MSGQAPERRETARMICERLRSDHARELAALLHDPRVSSTLWSEPDPPTEAEIVEGLDAKIEHWNRHGYGLWLLRDRVTGEMIGRGGLQHTLVTGEIEIEVGWAIVPERWGQGLATELALASIDVAFGALGMLELIAVTLSHNLASRRVMEKSGFIYERELGNLGQGDVVYRRRLRDGVQAVAGVARPA